MRKQKQSINFGLKSLLKIRELSRRDKKQLDDPRSY